MKIVAEFSSFEDMESFCRNVVAKGIEAVVKETVAKKAPKKETKAEEPEPAKDETPAEEPVKEEAPKYTLEDVRAALGALQKAGKRDEVKAILQSFGAAKLPEIAEEDYPAIMEKVGELNA